MGWMNSLKGMICIIYIIYIYLCPIYATRGLSVTLAKPVHIADLYTCV